MLTDLKLPTQQSRIKSKLIHNLADIPSNCLTAVPPYLQKSHFNQLNTRVDSFKFLFYPSANKLWNNLSQNIINAPTYTDFCNNTDTLIITPVLL